MSLGIVTVVVWGYTPWADHVFKALPGLLVPLLLYVVVQSIRRLSI